MIGGPCDKCHQQKASHYIVDITSGVKRELFFCASCIDEMGLTSYSIPIAFMQNIQIDIKCDSCGMTLSKYNITKRVGCAKDYELFNLAPTLEAYHHASQHVGKVPISVKYGEELATLKSALERAVGQEDYEAAAQIRDLIKQKEQL